MATTSSGGAHPHAHADAARENSKPAPHSTTTTATPRSTNSIWLLAPINPLAPPFYLAQVPSSIVVAAADAQQARKIASEGALTSHDAEAWLDEGLSSCDILAPAEPGIVARDFTPLPPASAPVVDLGPLPVNKDVPLVEGAGAVGATLTCTMGNWENMSAEPHSYTYAWQTDGASNSITGQTYAVLPPDLAHTISCIVTATNAAGSTAAPMSNGIAITSEPA